METISRALAASAFWCSREIKRFSLQLCSWGQSLCLPGTLAPSPTMGRPLGNGMRVGTLEHTPECGRPLS